MDNNLLKSILAKLEDNQDLLDNNDFETLYNKFSYYLRAPLTSILMKANINPLEYVEEIPNYYAFEMFYPENTKIIIPKNVLHIGIEAFYGCTNLKSVMIDGVKYINDSAFTMCKDLEEIDIREGTEIIGESVFNYCSHLIKVTFPSSLKEIGSKTFDNCNKLFGTSINFNGTMEQWNKINIFNPNGALYSLKIICTDGAIPPKIKFYL